MLVNLDYPKGSEVQGFQGLLVTKLGKNKLREIHESGPVFIDKSGVVYVSKKKGMKGYWKAY